MTGGESEELVTVGDAAFMVSTETRRPCSADAIRYYADRNVLPFRRASNGTRLFRAADVRRLAERLAGQDERRSAK